MLQQDTILQTLFFWLVWKVRMKTFKNARSGFTGACFSVISGKTFLSPTLPLSLGIRQTDLLTALKEEPWQVSQWEQERIKGKQDFILCEL